MHDDDLYIILTSFGVYGKMNIRALSCIEHSFTYSMPLMFFLPLLRGLNFVVNQCNRSFEYIYSIALYPFIFIHLYSEHSNPLLNLIGPNSVHTSAATPVRVARGKHSRHTDLPYVKFMTEKLMWALIASYTFPLPMSRMTS